MKNAVIDASVVLKWQLDDEIHVRESLALRDDMVVHGRIRLLAPVLLIYEVANGLTVACRRKRVPKDVIPGLVRNLLDIGIVFITQEGGDICATALRYDISAYDAAYISLAERERCELWTGDGELYKKTKEHFLHLRWVGDYKSGAQR